MSSGAPGSTRVLRAAGGSGADAIAATRPRACWCRGWMDGRARRSAPARARRIHEAAGGRGGGCRPDLVVVVGGGGVWACSSLRAVDKLLGHGRGRGDDPGGGRTRPSSPAERPLCPPPPRPRGARPAALRPPFRGTQRQRHGTAWCAAGWPRGHTAPPPLPGAQAGPGPSARGARGRGADRCAPPPARAGRARARRRAQRGRGRRTCACGARRAALTWHTRPAGATAKAPCRGAGARGPIPACPRAHTARRRLGLPLPARPCPLLGPHDESESGRALHPGPRPARRPPAARTSGSGLLLPPRCMQPGVTGYGGRGGGGEPPPARRRPSRRLGAGTL
jgi:hypothetical protein